MAKLTSNARFNFCGNVALSTRKEWIKHNTYNTNGRQSEQLSANIGIKDGGNCVFVTISEFKRDVIKTYDKDNQPIDIDWSDRKDPDIIAKVANYRKYVVDLGSNDKSARKEFITAWDMIEYLEDALPGYADKIVVTGDYTIRPAKGRYYESFNVRNVFAAREDEKPRFRLTADVYYNKESLDKKSDENGKKYFSAFVPMYINRDEGNKFLPFSAVLNTSAYSKDNERHVALLKYKTNMLTPKKDGYYHMNWEFAVVNGAEQVEFDESQLTEMQKEEIALGISTLDDFKPRGTIYGASTKEYRIVKPITRDEFADGYVESGFSTKDFNDMIYKMPVAETMKEVIDSIGESDDDDDLF